MLLSGSLNRQFGGSEFPQLVIYQREQFLRLAGIALFDLGKNLRDFGHRDQDTVEKTGNL